VRRREFISLISGAAVAWPLAARAQQPAMPMVGFLRSGTLTDVLYRVTAFHQGLKEAGFVEGQNVAIESRADEGQTDRLPLLVADLLRRQVALIVGNTTAALAAKAATTTVPIVFVIGLDPVRVGLVANLNRPGGNVTGVSFISAELAAKQLGLLRELRPGAARIAVLADPKFPGTERIVSESGLRLRSSDSKSKSSTSAAAAKSRPPLERSSNVALARCSSVVAGSFSPNGNGLPRWRPDIRRSTSSAILSRPAV
jgi:putative tryptophan/tyrosine transport system substrate-binding protein